MTHLPNSAPPAVRLHTITEDEAGQRVDNFLLRVCKGVPKSWVYRVVRKGEVRVNKGRIEVTYKLEVGDVVRIPPVRMSELADNVVPKHRATALPIVYEDNALLVIDKPARGVSQVEIFRTRASLGQRNFGFAHLGKKTRRIGAFARTNPQWSNGQALFRHSQR